MKKIVHEKLKSVELLIEHEKSNKRRNFLNKLNITELEALSEISKKKLSYSFEKIAELVKVPQEELAKDWFRRGILIRKGESMV